MPPPIQVVIDCADPPKLAEFWATALGYIVEPPPRGFTSWQEWLADQGVPETEWNSASAVVDPHGTGTRILFQRVPELKMMKNRMHLDINVGGPYDTPGKERRRRVEAAVNRLLTAGATVVEERANKLGERWVVMSDPEDNEFCVQ